jgi:hypothetical protein
MTYTVRIQAPGSVVALEFDSFVQAQALLTVAAKGLPAQATTVNGRVVVFQGNCLTVDGALEYWYQLSSTDELAFLYCAQPPIDRRSGPGRPSAELMAELGFPPPSGDAAKPPTTARDC